MFRSASSLLPGSTRLHSRQTTGFPRQWANTLSASSSGPVHLPTQALASFNSHSSVISSAMFCLPCAILPVVRGSLREIDLSGNPAKEAGRHEQKIGERRDGGGDGRDGSKPSSPRLARHLPA